jgi:Do/DeqQ family serine protease
VRRVSPLVVNVSSEYEIRQRVNPFAMRGMDQWFDSFFRDFFDPGYERRAKRTSLGSGVIIDGKRGYILTNAHVIAKTGKIRVVLMDEREYEAQIVGVDPDSDLAVLKIAAREALPEIALKDCEDPMIGETVIAIGNPFGFSHTVTTGVISALNRSIRTDEKVFRDFIQTDASINPGNSGGPLLNINGELIGINTAIYANAQGIGFAIPISKARRIVDDLIRHGEVIPAWIGVTVQDIDGHLTGYLGLPDAKGVMVKAVTAGGPAAKAGLREGDVIRSVGKKRVAGVDDFEAIIKAYTSGDTISASVWRQGRESTVSIRAMVFPMDQALALGQRLLGVQVAELTSQNRRRFGVVATKGALITELARSSYLAKIGAEPGDVIRQIDEIPINEIEDFKKAVVKYRQKRSVVILLQRNEQMYHIPVETNPSGVLE